MFHFFNRIPRLGLTVIILMLIVLTGICDYWISGDYYLFAFYLIPIFLGTWFVSRWFGVVASIVGATAWLAVDLLSNPGHLRRLWIPSGNMMIIIAVFLVFTFLLHILKRALASARDGGQIDYLTGVANRHLFFELAAAEINKANRYQRPITLVYFDLDHFKTINDTMGHDTGDRVILLVAHTMKMNIRGSDIIARLGGDEFAVMLPETGATAAAIVVDKIMKNLERIIRRNKWPVTMSCGVYTFVTPPLSVDYMVYKAGQLMREAKQAGMNQIKYYSE